MPSLTHPTSLPLTPDGFLSKQLQWRMLPADPHDPHEPPPRCRHLTLLLPALQGLPTPLPGALPPPPGGGRQQGGGGAYDDEGDDGEDVPLLSSTLVVFGGVGGDTWYRDVNILTINQSGVGEEVWGEIRGVPV